MKRILHLIFVLLIAFPTLLIAQKLDQSLFESIKPRQIGPAGMSGRITSIDVVRENPDHILVGSASGGLWESKNGGTTWKPLFDDQKALSIGAVKFNPHNPSEIWVGTGEGNPRNSQSSGYGIFKSLDGGKTWKHLGLENTRNIHRILINPLDPNIVYVGVQGSAWGAHPERGVYKTSDGGETWKKILYVNDETGIGEMVMDPENPNKIIAAMWQFRRWPWFFKSGGESSALYITHDGGKNWKKLDEENGLPKGDKGRMGLAIAPSDPEIVYALIEARENALYRSEDGGENFSKVASKNVGSRPFYYAEIYVDPLNENRIYNLYSIVSVSEDGGKTFEDLLPWTGEPTNIHLDHHAWYIHPDNPDFLIDGNDGGLNISHDRGKNWRFITNLPVGQFYHVNYDLEVPYNVYGGMQDNGSWQGPAYIWQRGGIRNEHWQEILFGDGFDVVPVNDKQAFGMYQGGNLYKIDLTSGRTTFVRPSHPEGKKLRFNWNAAIAADPHDENTIYYGSQFVHKSTDLGKTWETISPDLTTNDPEKQKQGESGGLTYDVTFAENYTTIVAISPSPLNKDVIWVGTDDGNLQITKDGGKTWTNVIRNIKNIPSGMWIPVIDASHHSQGEAYVVMNNYRQNDWSLHVYKTTDFGKSWEKIADKDQVWGYALSIVQDPVAKDLLFLGTEFGLYYTIDGGENWNHWQHGYPNVSTMDLKIHPRENDLIIGTFGRAFYIWDNISWLRELANQGTNVLKHDVKVYDSPDAYLSSYKQAAGTRFAAHAEFLGENRPSGAMITYSIGKLSVEDSATTVGQDTVVVQIFEGDKRIRQFKRVAKKGMNRTYWSLNRDGVRGARTPKPEKDEDIFLPSGPDVLPGNYKVKIIYGDHADSTMVEVKTDPREKITKQQLAEKEALLARHMLNLQQVTSLMDHIREMEKMLKVSDNTLSLNKEIDLYDSLKNWSNQMSDSLEHYKYQIVTDPDAKGIVRDDNKLYNVIGETSSYLYGLISTPTSSHEDMVKRNTEEINQFADKLNGFMESSWNDYVDTFDNAGISIVKQLAPLEDIE